MKEKIAEYTSILQVLLKSKEAIAVGAEVALLIVCTIFSLFTGIFKTLPAILLSAMVITILFLITKWLTENYVDKANRKKLYIGTAITSVIGLIAYIVIVYNREFEYLSDHVVYYQLQSELASVFNLSPIKGLYAIVSSCWNSDYSYFINVVLALPFTFTTGSNNSFVITYYVALIIPVCYMNNLFVLNIAQKLKVENVNLVAVLGNIVFLTFPLLHYASILGMPDIFGMFFVFGIVVIMMNYDFAEFSLSKSIIASILVLFLVVSRRWYIFTLIGLFSVIIAIKFIYGFLNKDKTLGKKTFFGEVKFIAVTAVVMLATLAPFIYKTLFVKDYSTDYSEYNFGGLPYEITNQMGFLGILTLVILFVGLVYGLINKNLRQLTLISLLGYAVTIYSYTTIQNMGKHQLLCLAIYYLILIYNTFILIDKIKLKPLKYALAVVIVAVFLLNTFSTITGYINEENGVYLLTKYAVSARFTWSF